jgi:hypothetical protein
MLQQKSGLNISQPTGTNPQQVKLQTTKVETELGPTGSLLGVVGQPLQRDVDVGAVLAGDGVDADLAPGGLLLGGA